MKNVIWKAFWNYDKEEKWLNEMSKKGMALSSYSWCRYVFEESAANQYIFRIELLEYLPSHPKSSTYIDFLEENGIECVATYMRWIYLRKSASESEFDLYSDKESKIKHLQRIYTFWIVLMFAELAIGLSNIMIGIIPFITKGNISEILSFNLIVGMMGITFGLLFNSLRLRIKKDIQTLTKEKIIRE